MINVKCNSKTYSYTFDINGSYTTAAHSVEEAKKNVLRMIEDGMDAAVNKKLDESLPLVNVDIDKLETAHEEFLRMRRIVNEC